MDCLPYGCKREVTRQAEEDLQHARDERRAALHRHAAPTGLSLAGQGASQELQDGQPLPPGPEPSEQEEFQAALAALPVWHRQLTLRGLLAGVVLGALFCIVTHKFSLTIGIIPSLNVATGLLGYVFVKGFSTAAQRLGFQAAEFGPQECSVVQTFITAAAGIAFAGGFGTYLLGLDQTAYDQFGPSPENRPQDVYNPDLKRVIPFVLCISMIGAFTICALRKTIIIDHDLPYPSGAAAGIMMDALFTSSGAKTAADQLRTMWRYFCLAFTWDAVKWVFSGTHCAVCKVAGSVCLGLESLPILGMKAAAWTFYLRLAPAAIAAGMITPWNASYSMLLGSVLTWGWLWPFIGSKAGEWYPTGLSSTDFAGAFGYKLFITIAFMIADGIYNVVKVVVVSALAFHRQRRALLAARAAAADALAAAAAAVASPKGSAAGAAGGGRAKSKSSFSSSRRAGEGSSALRAPLDDGGSGDESDASASSASSDAEEEERGLRDGGEAAALAAKANRLRAFVFVSETIPWWVSLGGYLLLVVLGAVVIPFCYPPVKWYYVIVGFLLGPLLAVPVAFGCGLTDWDVSSTMGKLAIFIFAAWAGLQAGGVVVGLIACGVVLAACSAGTHLMQDFRTGFYTMAAPRAMFASQVAGAATGALLAPLTFLLFWNTGQVGDPNGPYPAPWQNLYRGMAIFGTEGFSVLPDHCLSMMIAFFFGAIAINMLREVLPERYARWVPLPIGMAVPFLFGAYIAIDMCIGAAIMAVWKWRSPGTVHLATAGVAAGLIVGDGLWSIPMSVLGIAGVEAPMCASYQQ